MDAPQLNAPFDVQAATAQIGDAMAAVIKMTIPLPGEQPDEHAARAAWESMIHAITAGSRACNEVKRLTAALVNWPCSPWKSADRILNRTGA